MINKLGNFLSKIMSFKKEVPNEIPLAKVVKSEPVKESTYSEIISEIKLDYTRNPHLWKLSEQDPSSSPPYLYRGPNEEISFHLRYQYDMKRNTYMYNHARWRSPVRSNRDNYSELTDKDIELICDIANSLENARKLTDYNKFKNNILRILKA